MEYMNLVINSYNVTERNQKKKLTTFAKQKLIFKFIHLM